MQEAFTVALIEPNESIGQAIISELERLQFVKKILIYNRFDISDNCFLFRGVPVSNAPLDTITDPNIKLLIYCADDNSYPFFRSRINFDHQWLIDASGGSFDPEMLFFDQMDLERIKEVKLPHPIAYQYTLILDVFNGLYNLKAVNLFTACAVSTGGQMAMNELIMQTKAILNHEELEHGLNVREAIVILEQAIKSDLKVFKVIHGKGQHSQHQIPILKNMVFKTLSLHPRVIAFCSAKLNDGGVGATYVLLKGEN